MNLLKQKSWAVVIIDENEDSKEIKIINLLKENNYNVVGINLNNYKSDKFHVYESLKDIPHNGFIAIDPSNNKTTSTENPFSVSSYL